MICKLNDLIWFGDKASVRGSIGQVGSIVNAASTIRRPYWDWVGKLDWEVLYFHLGWPDRTPVTLEYARALDSVIEAVLRSSKFPLLCHCRMGGHRGPTTAMYAAWCIGGGDEQGINYWIEVMQEYEPGFLEKPSRRVFRQDIIKYCREMEKI